MTKVLTPSYLVRSVRCQPPLLVSIPPPGILFLAFSHGADEVFFQGGEFGTGAGGLKPEVLFDQAFPLPTLFSLKCTLPALLSFPGPLHLPLLLHFEPRVRPRTEYYDVSLISPGPRSLVFFLSAHPTLTCSSHVAYPSFF